MLFVLCDLAFKLLHVPWEIAVNPCSLSHVIIRTCSESTRNRHSGVHRQNFKLDILTLCYLKSRKIQTTSHTSNKTYSLWVPNHALKHAFISLQRVMDLYTTNQHICTAKRPPTDLSPAKVRSALTPVIRRRGSSMRQASFASRWLSPLCTPWSDPYHVYINKLADVYKPLPLTPKRNHANLLGYASLYSSPHTHSTGHPSTKHQD